MAAAGFKSELRTGQTVIYNEWQFYAHRPYQSMINLNPIQ